MKKERGQATTSASEGGAYTGSPSARVREGLRESRLAERERATRRQQAAGIEVVRTDFLRTDAQLDTALQVIWEAGAESKLLYCRIAKGLTCLNRADVLFLAGEEAATIESLAGKLAQGATLQR